MDALATCIELTVLYEMHRTLAGYWCVKVLPREAFASAVSKIESGLMYGCFARYLARYRRAAAAHEVKE